MAKRKGPKTVDLKPRAEKISEEHLEKIQTEIKAIDHIHFEIGKLESQKHHMLHAVSGHQQSLNDWEKILIKKYGTSDINIVDGTIKYNEEKNDNTVNKEDNDWKGL